MIVVGVRLKHGTLEQYLRPIVFLFSHIEQSAVHFLAFVRARFGHLVPLQEDAIFFFIDYGLLLVNPGPHILYGVLTVLLLEVLLVLRDLAFLQLGRAIV